MGRKACTPPRPARWADAADGGGRGQITAWGRQLKREQDRSQRDALEVRAACLPASPPPSLPY